MRPWSAATSGGSSRSTPTEEPRNPTENVATTLQNALGDNVSDLNSPGSTLKTFDVGDAINSLSFNLGRVIGDGLIPWATGKLKHKTKGRHITAWYIYMPIPVGTSSGKVIPTPIQIGGAPLKLRFGSTSHKHEGRITGMGVDFSGGAPESMLFRLDAGPINPKHGLVEVLRRSHGQLLGLPGEDIAPR